MPTPRSYADKDDGDGYVPTVHKDLRSNPRGYTPSDGEFEGQQGMLALDSQGGDWSWKPGRDRQLGDAMQTFRGVPPGAAELYGPRIRS